MAEGASDNLEVMGSFRSDSDEMWMPKEPSSVDQLDSDLSLMRNECAGHAKQLLTTARSYRYYSWIAMTSVPLCLFAAAPHLRFLNAKEMRVERVRSAAAVKSATMYAGFWGIVGFANFFLWPSPYGFRARADRLSAHASLYDGLGWDAGVVQNELRRGTLRPKALLDMESDRRKYSMQRLLVDVELKSVEAEGRIRADAAAESEPDVRAAFEKQFMTLRSGEESIGGAATGDAAEKQHSGPVEGDAIEGDDDRDGSGSGAGSGTGRAVVYDPYGSALAPWDADRAIARRRAALQLSPLAQVWHQLEERRFALSRLV